MVADNKRKKLFVFAFQRWIIIFLDRKIKFASATCTPCTPCTFHATKQTRNGAEVAHRAERKLRPREQVRGGRARAVLAHGHAAAHPRARRQPHALQRARRARHRVRARLERRHARVAHLLQVVLLCFCTSWHACVTETLRKRPGRPKHTTKHMPIEQHCPSASQMRLVRAHPDLTVGAGAAMGLS